MPKLILLRHGQSEWNLHNRFTGWHDVDLTEKGIREARDAGIALRENGFTPELAYTSVLKRAIRTLWLALEELDRMWIAEIKTWRLNERHYGALTGLDKTETATKYGDEQVHIWRRSYDTPPPELDPNNAYHPRFDPRYADLQEHQLPATESLKLTLERVLPYWEEEIAPALRRHECILIAAHGNSLRALVKHLEEMSDERIMEVEIPTGEPLIYALNSDLSVDKSYFLNH